MSLSPCRSPQDSSQAAKTSPSLHPLWWDGGHDQKPALHGEMSISKMTALECGRRAGGRCRDTGGAFWKVKGFLG